MTDRSTKTINVYDDEGIFVLMVDGSKQGPMILETEGEFSSRSAAEHRMRTIPWAQRVCVGRVVPVSGNELLALDMVRMQPKKEDDPF